METIIHYAAVNNIIRLKAAETGQKQQAAETAGQKQQAAEAAGSANGMSGKRQK